MDLNLFWYAQEALTRYIHPQLVQALYHSLFPFLHSPDVYLAPDTPFRGTQRAYELTQQRNQRITERAIRCHAYELQQSHNSIAQHFDKESLHAPTEKEPLLEFTCGDKFLRDNLHKIDKLLEDTETMMSSEYEPMDMVTELSHLSISCSDLTMTCRVMMIVQSWIALAMMIYTGKSFERRQRYHGNHFQ